jgi:N-acetyltransferase 10
MIEHHVILDLVPVLSALFFSRRLGAECTLSAAQQAILLALGLQRKPVEALEAELGLTPSQVLALFSKIIRRIVKTLQDVRKAGAGRDLPTEEPEIRKLGTDGSDWKPVEQTVEQELADEVDEETKAARAVRKEMLESVDLAQ